MKKLEDISKNHPYEVPDGYFDRLPGIIQARVAKPGTRGAFSWYTGLRLALPIILMAVVGIFWYRTDSHSSLRDTVADELETVEVDQLSLFLNDTDLTTDELVETVTWSESDLQALEDEVYSTIIFSTEQVEGLLDNF